MNYYKATKDLFLLSHYHLRGRRVRYPKINSSSSSSSSSSFSTIASAASSFVAAATIVIVCWNNDDDEERYSSLFHNHRYSQQQQQQQQQRKQNPSKGYYYYYYLLSSKGEEFNNFLCHQYATIYWNIRNKHKALCEAVVEEDDEDDDDDNEGNDTKTTNNIIVNHPSWIRKSLSTLGIMSLPIPRVLSSHNNDPSLMLTKKQKNQRRKDEEMLRKFLVETISHQQQKQDPMETNKKLTQEIFEITYGKGVTPQIREDFLLQYGCTGYTKEILDYLVDFCCDRGIVEIGAGHGQWSRALKEAYDEKKVRNDDDDDDHEKNNAKNQRGRSQLFDFVLAYDDMSNLPLNTHIYNPYTKPHHDYFGQVYEIRDSQHNKQILQSWACRGRALMLVYPPPGSMALSTLRTYTEASPEDNTTLIYVGEGRGGANADDSFFDFLESGQWILIHILNALPPPGDKGYEKLFVFQRRTKETSDK